MTTDIINRMKEECASDFIFSSNIMTIEGNPFDLIQSVSLLSGLAEVYYFITKLLLFFFFSLNFSARMLPPPHPLQ